MKVSPWLVPAFAGVTLLAVLTAPFLIADNSLAQAMFGIITIGMSTSIGVWASWNYSKNVCKERLTRYGLIGWRNIDGLSVKVRQQIQIGTQIDNVLESWLLDIDSAKLAWRDLLQDAFELQERLLVERDEVAIQFTQKIASATDVSEKQKLEGHMRLAMARIENKAPLPLPKDEEVDCPNCDSPVRFPLGTQLNSSFWLICNACNATFPARRQANGVVFANPTALKLSVTKPCPLCNTPINLRVSPTKDVHFLFTCFKCSVPIQCDGTWSQLEVSLAGLHQKPMLPSDGSTGLDNSNSDNSNSEAPSV